MKDLEKMDFDMEDIFQMDDIDNNDNDNINYIDNLDNLDDIDDIDDTDNNNIILEKLTNMADKIIDYENQMKNVNNLIIDEYNEILVPKSTPQQITKPKTIPKTIPKKMMKSKSAMSLTELTNSFKQKNINI